MTMMVSDIKVVSLNFVWILFEIRGLPVALTMVATACRLVGETIGPVLQVDEPSTNCLLVRVCVTFPLNTLVRLDKRLRVSPIGVIQVKVKYERLLRRCTDCIMINHKELCCPRRLEVAPVLAPALVASSIVFRTKTGKSPKKRGLPGASRNKKKLFGEASKVTDSMAPNSSGFLQWL
ncbi:hypothetical protein ACLB2K_053486 [Fragaria x ananassa]